MQHAIIRSHSMKWLLLCLLLLTLLLMFDIRRCHTFAMPLSFAMPLLATPDAGATMPLILSLRARYAICRCFFFAFFDADAMLLLILLLLITLPTMLLMAMILLHAFTLFRCYG